MWGGSPIPVYIYIYKKHEASNWWSFFRPFLPTMRQSAFQIRPSRVGPGITWKRWKIRAWSSRWAARRRTRTGDMDDGFPSISLEGLWFCASKVPRRQTSKLTLSKAFSASGVVMNQEPFPTPLCLLLASWVDGCTSHRRDRFSRSFGMRLRPGASQEGSRTLFRHRDLHRDASSIPAIPSSGPDQMRRFETRLHGHAMFRLTWDWHV